MGCARRRRMDPQTHEVYQMFVLSQMLSFSHTISTTAYFLSCLLSTVTESLELQTNNSEQTSGRTAPTSNSPESVLGTKSSAEPSAPPSSPSQMASGNSLTPRSTSQTSGNSCSGQTTHKFTSTKCTSTTSSTRPPIRPLICWRRT
jgi:hypothetical protein